MNLQYMCSNLVRITVPVNDEPFFESAQAGLLDEEMLSIIQVLYQEHGKLQVFQDISSIYGVTFPGVLTQPDSLPLELYGDHDITIFCDWNSSPITALYESAKDINESESAWEYLRVSEAPVVKDPSAAINPYVLEFYVRCQEIFGHLQNKGQSGAVRDELGQLNEKVLIPVNKIVSSLKPDSSDYHDALNVNSVLMTGLMTNLQILAG